MFVDNQTTDQTGLACFFMSPEKRMFVFGFEDYLGTETLLQTLGTLVESQKVGFMESGSDAAILCSVTCLTGQLANGHLEISTDDAVDTQIVV